MLETVVSVFSVFIELGKCLTAPLGRQFGYLRNYKTNFDSLRQEADKLTDARERLHHRVDDAERQGEEIEQDVQRWLTSVDEAIKEADKIIEDEGKSLCFKGLCPNLKTRYQLSKDAVRKLNDIKGLREEGKFEVVSYRTLPQEIWLSATKGYVSFESRMKTMRDIQKALSDPNVSMIGVYGMGGIGKTTLVREIASQAEKDKLFDEVVFAHVSHNPDIRKIQGEIADKIGLEFREETEPGRARKLRQRLSGGKKNPPTKDATDLDMERSLHTSSCKVETEAGRNTKQELSREKNVLVILDDIWKDLDLETIGIPLGQNNKGCKVLLTTRNLNVLTDQMYCYNNIQVGSLHEEEAWILFKKMAGDSVENRDIQPVAIDIAKECSGLPIAIVTVASTLRNKSIFQWKDALRELKRPSKRGFTGVQAVTYSTIEFSYNHLEDDEIRSIFLLCSVMADYPFVSDLLKYCIGLGLLQDINSVEEARNRIYSSLQKLDASCLLLDGQNTAKFCMHDVVRDVALSIASRDQHIFTLRGETVSNKDIVESCTAIYLNDCDISELAEGLECTRLEFFHTSSNNFFLKIHENFFTGMTKLKVLDLTSIQLLSLPSSIRLLGNLRTLCLDQSELGDIAIIGELKKLEILSFICSNIEQLPKEIGHLSCLKLLDLSNCYKLKFIPANVISSLSQLEELYMGNTSIQWDNEGTNTERRNASLHELKHLSRLTNLEIHIKDARILPRGLFSEKLERYKIYIGDEWVWSRKYEGTRTLKLKVNTSICMEDEVTMQLREIEVLYLDELQATDNVLCKVDKGGFPQLKHLHVQNNPYFLCILDSMEWLPHEAFPQLESLCLSNLIKMEKICYGQLTAKSFCKLNILKVDKCDKLKNIFSLSMVESLPQLKTMEVAQCKAMEEIFAVGRKDDVNNNEVISKIELGQLRFLTLKSLPQLNGFCSKMDIPSMSLREVPKDIEVVSEDEHDTPTILFNKMALLPKLEALEISAINCEKIWQNQPSAISSSVQNLTRLIVQGCGNLKYIFSSSIVTSLLKLQRLEVCRCPVLKEILVMDSSREQERKRITFPQLNFLRLEDLENLTRFCLEYSVEFTSLKQLEIKQCPKFKAIVLENMGTEYATSKEVGQISSFHTFLNEKVSFPELEEMRISNLDNLKMIWDNKLAHRSLSKLKLIKVEGCDKLVTLFPSNTFRRFSRLEYLTIDNCASLEVIFGIQELDFEETYSPFIIHLKQVNVFNCGSLQNVFEASIAKNLLQLEKLEVKSCGVLTEIVAEERREKASAIGFVFPMLSLLYLAFLPKLTTFYPGVHTSEWPMLEHLVVADCENVKTFALETLDCGNTKDDGQLMIPVQQPFFLVEKVVPRLKFLELNIKDIIMLCHGQFARLRFSKLDTLFIREDEAAVFSPVLLERYTSLKTLLLCYSSYKEIFSHEDVEKHVENFGRISCLRLESLSQLKRIWRQDSKLNSILQNLEILHVEDCDNLINLVPSSASFRNLTILKVCYCVGLTNLISSSTAKSLESLKQMKIKGCKGMTDIVANEGNAGEDEIVLNKLEELSLVDLESLKSFCSMNYTFRFPSLDVLIVRDCPKMKIFCEGNVSTSKLTMVCQSREDWKLDKGYWKDDLNTTIQQLQVELRNLESMDVSATDFEKICQNQCPEMTSRFQNLKRLVVKGSGNLTYLFSSYTVRSFLQLQHLEICKCPAVHEIIAMEELRKEERKDIIFPQLNFLKIEDLENLTRFCLENYVEFPALKQLEIKQCPNFKAFVLNNYIDLTTAGETRKMSSMDIQAFFNDKVALPDLEEMVLSHLDNLKMIWDNKLANHSFNKQKSVKVEGCDKLLILFPSSILGRLSRLKSLTVDNCGSLEVIFGIQESNFEETHSMLDLKLMSVTKCQNLKIIFPTTVARSLLQLEDLEIIDCGILEEIVSKEGRGEASAVKFFFPKVARLVLKDLPALTNFYPGVHTSEWPMLEVLVVYGCEKVKVVALEYLYCQKAKDESHLDIPAKQPLLLFEKIIPRLEVLGLSGQEIMKILYGQFPRHLFSKIKDLGIREDESAVFPLGLFEKFYRLEKLKLRHGSYKELFSNGDVEKHVGSLAGIKELLLESLSEMKHLWKQDAKLNLVLQHLEILEVEKCNSLVSLLPPSAFLSNLTTLKVCYCNGMVNLATSLTAKSLQHLRNISIEGCKRMAEIVANEGDEAEDEIVFNKLEELSLVGLESLISFCSMNCTFNFPSLDVLIVRDCPKMKIFSEGALRISKLEIVCQNREDWFVDKGCWEGDLNTTIQKLHNKMNVQSSEEDSGQPSEHHME